MSRSPASKTQIAFICAGLFCFLTAFVLLHSFQGRFVEETPSGLPKLEETIDVNVPQTALSADSGPVAAVPSEAAAAQWVVYVTGFVKNPGVYRIAPGSRVYQALEAAGGFAADADREGINLAAPLQDGVHIRFPGKNEGEPRPVQPTTAMPAQYAKAAWNIADFAAGHSGPPGNTPNHIIKHSPAVAWGPSGAGVVNLNTCSAADLTGLPGIGPKTAELIIAYRKSNGRFARVEDLLLIKGVGPKKYDAIRNLITVEPS